MPGISPRKIHITFCEKLLYSSIKSVCGPPGQVLQSKAQLAGGTSRTSRTGSKGFMNKTMRAGTRTHELLTIEKKTHAVIFTEKLFW